jgi:hypothetical protein
VLTIFAVPKPFQGHIETIQLNAIRSWQRLGRDCQVILCGDEPGVAEVAAACGVDHISEIETNRFGTPLLSSVFRRAQDAARHEVVCYANADLILFPDLLEAIARVSAAKRRFMLVGRSWDLDVDEDLAPLDGARELDLRRRVAADGIAREHDWIDFFVFRRHGIGPLPPFAVGRPAWDNWMIWRARKLRLALVDVSRAALVIHQTHDYAHVQGARGYRWAGPEGDANKALVGVGQSLSLRDATHRLDPDRLAASRGGAMRRLRTELCLHSWTIPVYRALRWAHHLRLARPLTS